MTPNVVVTINYSSYNNNINSLIKEKINKYIKEREFYSCREKYNYVNYVNDGSKEKIDYIDYSGNSEKSSGVFNQNGLLSKNEIKELKQRLSETKSVIWHGVISFEEEFGKKYCFSTEQAINLMKRKFPRFFKNMGLKDGNVEWFAGLHENTDNRHIHFSFYEREPQIISSHHAEPIFRRGKIKLDIIEKFKIDIEMGLTDIKNCFGISRTELIKTTKERLIDQKIALNKEMKQLLKSLELEIPLIGRLSYDSENMASLRPKIQRIIDLIILKDVVVHKKFNKYLNELYERERQIKDICLANNLYYAKFSLLKTYTSDFYRRMGNTVLKSLQMISIRQACMEKKAKWRIIQKRIEKQKMKALFDETLYLSRVIAEEAFRTFDEHMAMLDEMEYKRLVEEGIIEL